MKPKKPLPKNALVGIVVVGGLLALAIGWFLVVSPQKHHVADLEKRTSDVQAQIASNEAAIAAAKTASSVPAIKVADVYKLAQAMPEAPDMPDLLLEVDQVAAAAGVKLESISPGTGSAGAGYTTLTLSLNVTGDFYSVTDLLYRLRNLVYVRNGALEASGRIFDVKSVSFSPSGTSVSAAIALDTYVYAGGSAATTTTATPPATTSTDTTTTTTTPDSSSSDASAAAAP